MDNTPVKVLLGVVVLVLAAVACFIAILPEDTTQEEICGIAMLVGAGLAILFAAISNES